MIRRHALAFRTTLMLADAGLAIVLVFLLSIVRFGREQALPTLDSTLPDARAVVLVFAGAWVVTLWMHGLYRTRARWTFRSEAGDILRAALTFAIATLAFLYVFKLPDVSRLLMLLLFPSMAAMALVTRTGMRLLLVRLRRRGRNARFMLAQASLVLGDAGQARDGLDQVLREDPNHAAAADLLGEIGRQ